MKKMKKRQMSLTGVTMRQKVNVRLLVVLILLLVIAMTYISEQKYYNQLIRTVLEWKQLGISLWAGVVICFIIHGLSAKQSGNEYTGIIYKHFGVFADSAFAAITYGLALTTSASILKGIYIQQFFGDVIYFNHIESLDIYSMLVVSVFLFGYSVWASIKAAWSAIVLSSSEKAEPVLN